jgi:hypothetical protein
MLDSPEGVAAAAYYRNKDGKIIPDSGFSAKPGNILRSKKRHDHHEFFA